MSSRHRTATPRALPDTGVLPKALYRAAQVRALDRLAIEHFGIPGDVLMERAGEAAFRRVRDRWPAAQRLLVLAGPGNNGGDALVVARLAHQAGLSVTVWLLGDDEDALSPDCRRNLARWQALGSEVLWPDHQPAALPPTDLVIDGLFGIGLSRPVSGRAAALIAAVNAAARPVLALDIPSGLHADTGQVLGVAVRAACTLSFIGLKQGLCTGDGPDHVGELCFAGLGVPAQVYAGEILAARRLAGDAAVWQLPVRERSAHKGRYGHVLVIGGAPGYGGAARLCAEAALRCGAGLVSLLTHERHVDSVLAARPEIMVHGLAEPAEAAQVLPALLARASVIAVGPGLGRDAWGRALWTPLQALQRASKVPLVVDADALNLLAEAPARGVHWVLTPHPGEAARLLGLTSAAAVQADRFAALEQLCDRYDASVVLKGAGSLIGSPGQRPPAVCTAGNPGMASGGMGDLLTGVIAALIAQGVTPELAAEQGVCLHAAAADRAAADGGGERGLLATDLLPVLRRLINQRAAGRSQVSEN